MERGTIPRIFDYYFGKPQFREEILRALRQFFNRPDLGPGKQLELRDEKDEKMFNEWFVFDFKLSNSKTPLEDFYEKNPYNLDMVRLQVYKDLQNNHFGFYKVKNIRLGEGLTLENLQTGKIYQVREFAATFGLKKEQVFPARVGKVGDHYELVGCSPIFGPVKLDATLENLYRKDKKELNPKILRDSFFESRKSPGSIRKEHLSPEEYPSLETAEANLNKVLIKYSLDQLVTTSIIKEWIYNQSADDPINFLQLLWSLVYPDRRDYSQALTEILNSFSIFYNLCPQKELGNKSPFEKAEEQDEKGIPPDIRMTLSKFSPSDWGRKYHKALEYMKKAQFKKALKKINEVFAYLLEQKITYPEIYRLYANKGVCHLALGEAKTGEFMLKISAELNPLYHFAKQQLRRYKKANIASQVTEKKEDITRDIGYRYYQFLKPFKINFAHIPKPR